MKYKTIFLGLSIASITALTPVKSASNQLPTDLRLAQNPCDERNLVTQSQMNDCAVWQYRQADQKLNQVYQQLRPQLSGSRQELLIDAQLAWIAFKDKKCEFERNSIRGGLGSMGPVITYGCLQNITEERSADLESYSRGQIPQPNSRNYQEADRQLNLVYQRAISQVTPELLRAAQLAWIDFRDANCAFEGSQSSTDKTLCLTRMTEKRTQELSKLVR